MCVVLYNYLNFIVVVVCVDPNYEALCDVSVLGKMFSCSKVFNSEYGHLLFGVPNAAWGLVHDLPSVCCSAPETTVISCAHPSCVAL